MSFVHTRINIYNLTFIFREIISESFEFYSSMLQRTNVKYKELEAKDII